jgi:hypothetical protein
MNEPAHAELHVAARASATPALDIARRNAPTGVKHARETAVPAALVDIQNWMVSAITEPDPSAHVEDVLTGGPRLSAEDRLEVYRSAYFARLIECLRDDYPVLAELLGEDGFEALCCAYVEAHPSENPNLNFFGRHMAAFCRHAEVPALEPVRAFAADLATLEWTMVVVLHAEASAPLNLSALQAIPLDAWATARLVPSHAVRLLRFDYPVNPYFQAARVATRPTEPPPPAKSATVVYRSALTLWRMDLTPAMTSVLSALLDGAPIGDALDRLGVDVTDQDALAEAERSVMAWFSEWVNGGMFSAVLLASAPP